jgi:hypothetical protein
LRALAKLWQDDFDLGTPVITEWVSLDLETKADIGAANPPLLDVTDSLPHLGILRGDLAKYGETIHKIWLLRSGKPSEKASQECGSDKTTPPDSDKGSSSKKKPSPKTSKKSKASKIPRASKPANAGSGTKKGVRTSKRLHPSPADDTVETEDVPSWSDQVEEDLESQSSGSQPSPKRRSMSPAGKATSYMKQLSLKSGTPKKGT